MSESNMSNLILKTNVFLGTLPGVFSPESTWPWTNQDCPSVSVGTGGQPVHHPAVHKSDFTCVSHSYPLL